MRELLFRGRRVFCPKADYKSVFVQKKRRQPSKASYSAFKDQAEEPQASFKKTLEISNPSAKKS